jgi:hypothetical protein
VCCSACEFVEQCFGLLRVGGGKALAKPASARHQHLVGFGAVALARPQAAQAQHRSQLQRLGLRLAGHFEGLTKAGFRLRCMVRSKHKL